MIVVDENVIASQCELLRAWQIPCRQIGHDLGHAGMDDKEEIIPLLHRLPRATFFTRDADLYDRRLFYPFLPASPIRYFPGSIGEPLRGRSMTGIGRSTG